MNTLKENTLVVNQLKLTYWDNQAAAKNTVVFLHGFPFDKTMWQPQLQVLQDHYRVIALDVRGHGNSEAGDQPFSIELFADDLLTLLKTLEIEKAIVCGLSMGGYIALNAVTRFPERFKGLILCDTNCFADSPEGKEKRMKTIESLPKIGMKRYAAESVKNLFAAHSLENKPEVVRKIQEIIENTPETTIVKTLQALANRKETCEQLSKLNLPTMILVGEQDAITPLSAAEVMWDYIVDSELFIVEQAGHIANLENSDDFNTYLQDFLKTIS